MIPNSAMPRAFLLLCIALFALCEDRNGANPVTPTSEVDACVWTLAGIVYYDSVDTSMALPGAHVTVTPQDTSCCSQTVLTLKDGAYSFEGLYGGSSHRVRCTAPGFHPFDTSGIDSSLDSLYEVLLDMEMNIRMRKQ